MAPYSLRGRHRPTVSTR
ncbi:hypothetical protein LCL61_18880 [Amycolatopsis coloradensis]|uniref:Uncharacterized protein n=1 Tax=Amycolatopsis coloradensis TaxID=76021 RepID=A0ACD5BEG7_9PSEU